MRPARTPIGLQLTQTSRAVSRAFDDALAAAGGSLPVWLVLISLKSRSLASQRELAEVMGIREATLTHHLTSMEASGLISRRRDAANRRIQVVDLTAAGEEMFGQLAGVAQTFDKKLRRGVSAAEVAAPGGPPGPGSRTTSGPPRARCGHGRGWPAVGQATPAEAPGGPPALDKGFYPGPATCCSAITARSSSGTGQPRPDWSAGSPTPPTDGSSGWS